MKKKAFTLIEVLAVIIVLTVILVITVPAINNILSSAYLNSFVASEKMMINATKLYLNMNDSSFPSNVGDTVEVKLSSLQSRDLISSIKSPWNKNDICDGYILITKVDFNAYDYTPYLKCDNNYKADSYITDGLMASWKFDGNAYDYTPNSTQGLINNVATTDNRFDVAQKALDFNGPSNFIDTNYDYSLDYNKSTTFSLWVKFDSINTSGKVKNMFGKNSKEYILSQVDNKIQFTVWNNSGEYAIQLTSNTNIVTNKWYNISVVYDSLDKKVHLYIDGKIDNIGSILRYPFANKAETLKIGRGYPDEGSASSTFFLGVIDNLSVYERALSPFEIKLNYDVDQLMKW